MKISNIKILSAICTILGLYVFGNFGVAKPEGGRYVEFAIFELLLALSFGFSSHYLIKNCRELNSKWLLFLAILCFVWCFGILYGGIDLYVFIGKYFRDILGINIFYMDWAGWSFSSMIYGSVVIISLVHKLWKKK